MLANINRKKGSNAVSEEKAWPLLIDKANEVSEAQKAREMAEWFDSAVGKLKRKPKNVKQQDNG